MAGGNSVCSRNQPRNSPALPSRASSRPWRSAAAGGRRSELAGYRLLGAFAAVESVRVALVSKGVTFNMKAPS